MVAWLSLGTCLAASVLPSTSVADSLTGATAAQSRLDFRIVIPAVIRVTPVVQPDHIVVESNHIEQGYIDLDGGTAIKLTSNSRSGFQLSASFDSQLLSRVEVRVSNQSLHASSGFGSMRVLSGLIVDKLVPISYRLHLLPGARAGQYRWPVALVFSLAST